MTPARLAELRRLCEEATDGPWQPGRSQLCDCYNRQCWNVWQEHDVGAGTDVTAPCAGLYQQDAAFIAAARTALPELIAEVERLRDVERVLRREVRRLGPGDEL